MGDSLKDSDKAFEYGIDFIGVCGLFSHEQFEARHANAKTVQNIKEILSI